MKTVLCFSFQNFEVVFQKSTYRFIQPLDKNTNSVVMAMKNHVLCVLINIIFGKQRCTLFQQHAGKSSLSNDL